jgi:hypothetical protein
LSLELGYIQPSVEAQLDLAIWLFSLLLGNTHFAGTSFQVLLPFSSMLTRHMPYATLSPTHVAEGVMTTLDTALTLHKPRPRRSISKELYCGAGTRGVHAKKPLRGKVARIQVSLGFSCP